MVVQQQEPTNDKTHMVFMTIVETEGQLFSDQTGRFPTTSNRRNCHVVVFYCTDPNSIKSHPTNSRHRSELLKAYTDVYSYLRARGYRTKLHPWDNEASRDVEEFITEQQAKFQYTPPDQHRTNSAERAIRTWKNHFMSMLANALVPFFLLAGIGQEVRLPLTA